MYKAEKMIKKEFLAFRRERFDAFCHDHPALIFGISFLLGAFAFFEGAIITAFLWIGAIFWVYRKPLKTLLQAAAVLTMALYCYHTFSHLPDPGEGRAIFSIRSLQRHASPFQSGWQYTGTLQAFESASGKQWTASVECRVIYTGDDRLRPKATCDYLIDGQLRQQAPFVYAFKAKTWTPIATTWSMAEMRYSAKERIRAILNHYIPDSHTADFLNALFTGDIQNRMLRFEFGRLGLQYLLVISGFHFAILAGFVASVTRLTFPLKLRTWVLLFTATVYFLFVGNSPPVLRSFLAASILLIGQLLGRRSSGLNILGACLLIEILLTPPIVLNIGFQLSFLSCLGIFFLHHPIQHLLRYFFPQRFFHDLTQLHWFSQCAYLASSFFARALYLTIAVNIALGPLLLYHFHHFSWLGLFYNLFAPAWTALSLFFLLSSLALYLIAPLFSLPFFWVTKQIACHLLDLIAHPPVVLDYGISFALPGWAIVPYFAAIFGAAIHWKYRDSSLSG
jgi:competence protein ComEC